MTVGAVVIWVLQLYVLVLLAYVVLSWVMVYARDWQPRGVLLLLSDSTNVERSGTQLGQIVRGAIAALERGIDLFCSK